MLLHMYVLGNVLYLTLQQLVYLGYKLDSLLDAQRLHHALLSLSTGALTLVTLSATTLTVGTVAICLVPLLPLILQHNASVP